MENPKSNNCDERRGMFSFTGGQAKCMEKEGGNTLSDIYIGGEKRESEERKARERERESRKERDREKGIRAGITLGDCGIVNPCRALLSCFSYFFLRLSFSLFHPPSSRPPTLFVAFIALLFPALLLLSLSLFLSLSSTYPSHGLVRHWNIGEQSENRRESGGMKQHPVPTVLSLPTLFLSFPLVYSFTVSLFLSLSLFPFLALSPLSVP